MPTVSEIFATTRDGLPNFYQTMDRPQGEIGVDGHDELLNYRYVGGEVFVRATSSRDRLREVFSAADFDSPEFPAPGAFAAPPGSPSLGESAVGDGISSGGPTTPTSGADRIRLTLPDPTKVPDTVDLLTAANIPSSPHHVYVSGNHTQFGPADSPEDVSPPNWAAEFLHAQGPRGPGSSVAIIDTGLLRPKQTPFPFNSAVAPFDLEDNQQQPNGSVAPYIGHGTFVAGRVLQQSPSSHIIMVRPQNVWETANGLSLAMHDDDLAMALARAVAVAAGIDAHADGPDSAADFAKTHFALLDRRDADVPSVLNLSLSGTAHSIPALNEFSGMRDLLDVWAAHGTKIVASAGNEHSRREHFPGAYDDVLCVGAHDGNGTIADFSNFGPWVNMYAPGVKVESWFIGPGPAARTGYAKWSGTSFAAPYVAGLIAK